MSASQLSHLLHNSQSIPSEPKIFRLVYTSTLIHWNWNQNMLLSLHLRSQANIHGRPTDESSISSKSAVHFLKMIHLRDFAPFICFSFSEWRILFLLFSDFANSTMESSPTKYPTEAQDATRWTHGYCYNHVNLVIAHFFAIISAIAQFLNFISLLSILHTFAVDN